jgi:hypothetical protein
VSAEDEILGSYSDMDVEALAAAAGAELGLKLDDAKLDKDQMARWQRYIEALREVMRMESRAGLIVLRYWLECSMAFGDIFVSNSSIYKNAALADFSRERMNEMAIAGPSEFYQFLHQGHRDAAWLLKQKDFRK